MATDGSFAEVSRQSVEYIEQMGSMPEIHRASADLRAALDATRAEIESAELASRFPKTPSDNFRALVDTAHLSPLAKLAVESEGEAGMKRAQLLVRASQLDLELNHLIYGIVELRADVKTSQIEY
ncbi:MAG TPA: hypothetical protein VHB51_03260 [Candidatus Saccharimonadales bacterium]|nr:hypothetical protein [Candidatus Saccharimonadales bacterium]